MELHAHAGDDAEVSAAAACGPEQIWLVARHSR
jgi:hypothetical protein